MAIDTAQKRYSMMDFGSPYPIHLFEPDGAVDLDDRQHLLALYSGIVITVVVVIPPSVGGGGGGGGGFAPRRKKIKRLTKQDDALALILILALADSL